MNNNRLRILLPHRLLGNIYVRELGRAYQKRGHEAYFGQENFFESAIRPDVIHLHWPETLYRAWGEGSLDQKARDFLDRLRAYRDDGIPLVWTIHNLAPHGEHGNPVDAEVYREVAALADMQLHHCELSKALFEERVKSRDGVIRLVVEHGHFLAQPDTIDTTEARRRLEIPDGAFVFLLFGNLKSYKGVEPVLDAFARLRSRNAYLVVAGGGGIPGWRGRWIDLKSRLPAALQGRVRFYLGHVEADDVQVYAHASDAWVLGHQAGLNSGVAAMGMSFGKMVIGPRLGCIEAMLAAGRNLLYPTGDVAAMRDAMRAAMGLDVAAAGAVNREVVARWTWENQADAVLTALRELPA